MPCFSTLLHCVLRKPDPIAKQHFICSWQAIGTASAHNGRTWSDVTRVPSRFTLTEDGIMQRCGITVMFYFTELSNFPKFILFSEYLVCMMTFVHTCMHPNFHIIGTWVNSGKIALFLGVLTHQCVKIVGIIYDVIISNILSRFLQNQTNCVIHHLKKNFFDL